MGERVRPGNVRRFGTVWNSRVPLFGAAYRSKDGPGWPRRGRCAPASTMATIRSIAKIVRRPMRFTPEPHRPANAVHSRTSYWNATPSGSFCRRNNPGGEAAGRIVAGPAAGPLTCPDRAARRQDRDRQSSEFYRAAPLKHGLSKRGPGG
jgi:hypothetical protein